MATPDTRSSIVIVKSFSYKGQTRRWSNRYHFEGAVPADDAHWQTFADNITADEKALYASDCSIVEAIGYNSASATPTNPHGDAVFTKTYALAGTGGWGATGHQAPGDCAALLRYSTLARSTKNHPVYLFNYFHNAFSQESGVDTLLPAQATAITAYGTQWVTGYNDGTGLRSRCGPRGAGAEAATVATYITHRDFPR